ncbi:cupin domain-containing protein [Ancylobacter amanitiformis]|uniref:Cupin superfamily protein n=1 Tax=Ancylobacter amanitiformis TaxID=217069 RepID=A0ABU0LXY4_9HYPH|nr:cupin domain-containing protein [Ancylobacter amanitiformis]MDQ0513530.1 putative cupin superfamily protein [Ancylobacter amanitiformis]
MNDMTAIHDTTVIHDTTANHDHSTWFLNGCVSVRLAAAQGPDRISIVEHRMAYGDGPPLHVHHNEDEVFHVLEGTIRVQIDGVDHVLRAGDITVAPKRIRHAFRVESLSGARFLTICRGSDFESLIAQGSRPALMPGLPPMHRPSAEQAAAFAGLCLANNIELVGPPLD